MSMEHLEGRESILAALRARSRRFQTILLKHGLHAERTAEIVAAAGELGVPVRWVEPRELDALAHGATHGGMIAICSPRGRLAVDQLLELIAHRPAPRLLLLEGIEDARNLGFVLRTADALGFDAVLIKKHVWDFDAVEVARPASGAYERIPLAQVDDAEALLRLKRAGLTLLGCLGNARRAIDEADLRGPVLLAIGGEKRGLSGAVRAICDGFVTIPTRGGAASLSLSHAAAIVMAEASRQRRNAATE